MWGSMFSLVVGRVSYQEVIHDLGPRTQRLLLTLHTVSAPIYVFHCCLATTWSGVLQIRPFSTKDTRMVSLQAQSLCLGKICENAKRVRILVLPFVCTDTMGSTEEVLIFAFLSFLGFDSVKLTILRGICALILTENN